MTSSSRSQDTARAARTAGTSARGGDGAVRHGSPSLSVVAAPAAGNAIATPRAWMGTDASTTQTTGPATAITILTFHGIGPTERDLTAGERSTWITTAAFEAILDLCVDDAGQRADVAITFDDANESDVTIALPALRRRRLTATFFIPAAALGREGWLDATGVRALVAAGMRIGSHGMHHRPWTGLDVASARVEMFEARDRLEAWVEGPVTDAACPFGAYDRRTLHRLRDAGYLRVFTSDRGRAAAGAWLLPRNTVRPADHAADVGRLLGSHPDAAHRAARALRLAWKRWR